VKTKEDVVDDEKREGGRELVTVSNYKIKIYDIYS